MLHQNIIQVYSNYDGDAVVVVGIFDQVGKNVSPESIVIPFGEIRAVAFALNKIADMAEEELE